MTSDPLAALGHDFRQPELLRQALTHRSFGADHNERLEFIGDSVLNCVVALGLYRRFPQIAEGELSRVRANLVNKETLHRLSQALNLGKAVRLGEGEIRSGGATRPSILADTLEALFGAILIDGGFEAAQAAILRVYADELDRLDPAELAKDPKTRLQELLQGRRLPVPEYAILNVTGEAHVQTFEVVCRVPALGIEATGTGASRRSAEQAAATDAYEQAASR